MTKIIESINEWQKIRKNISTDIGFVPTMGALHAAHLSLVTKAQTENEIVVVSLFVNPTQFNDPKDFERYPNTMAADINHLKALDVDYILVPKASEIYHDNYRYILSEQTESKFLCGASRKGHFEGVLTVVLKLLNLVRPEAAYFGEKDYQQFLLIRDMASALFLPVKIVPCPTLRESDGLAMSSRNMLLSPSERELAPSFHQELEKNIPVLEIKNNLEKHGFKIDYIEERYGRRFGAVFLGSVRLIDNVTIK